MDYKVKWSESQTELQQQLKGAKKVTQSFFLRIQICMHMCVYTHTYMYMYTCVHTYTPMKTMCIYMYHSFSHPVGSARGILGQGEGRGRVQGAS